MELLKYFVPSSHSLNTFSLGEATIKATAAIRCHCSISSSSSRFSRLAMLSDFLAYNLAVLESQGT